MKDKSKMLSSADFPKMRGPPKIPKFPKMREPPKIPEFPKIGEGYQHPEMKKREFPKPTKYVPPRMDKYERFLEERKKYDSQ